MLEARSLIVRRGRDPARPPVLDGVDLTLAGGDILAIVGPNGAGKTTLLRCLAGVLAPSQGRITLKGRSLGEYSRRELARLVAYSPQEGEDRLGFTVREGVLLGRHPRLSRFEAPAVRDLEAAESALLALDMAHLADRPVTQLSGGEKRRAALARTLAQADSPETALILLDEPAAGLDIRHAFAAMRVFVKRASGTALAVVLHDLNLAAMFCPMMLMLDAGRVAAYGPTPEVLTAANVASVFGVRASVDGTHVRFLEE